MAPFRPCTSIDCFIVFFVCVAGESNAGLVAVWSGEGKTGSGSFRDCRDKSSSQFDHCGQHGAQARRL